MRGNLAAVAAGCLLCVCLVGVAHGTDYPPNERPMYGNIQKTPAMLEADRAFIDAVLETGMTQEQGAVAGVKRGWEALNGGDVRTAIRRFNQAWLLDPEGYGAYWGFGVVLFERDRVCAEAFGMFDRAVALGGDNPSLLVDYGRICEQCGEADKAIPLLERGLSIDPGIRDGYIGLMFAYGRKGDFEQAWRWSERAAKRNLLPSYSKDDIETIITEVLKKR